MATKLRARDTHRHGAWTGEITSALEAQNVVVIGTDAAGTVPPHLVRQPIALYARRHDAAAGVEALVKTRPLYQILTSMPGIGARTAAAFIAETLGRSFDTGAHLASYAELTPVTRHSGSSTRGEHTSHADSKRLKRAIFLPTFALPRSNPISRAYYDHKIAQGKRHSQTVIVLTHHRILTLHAMIRDATLYNLQPTHQLPAVA